MKRFWLLLLSKVITLFVFAILTSVLVSFIGFYMDIDNGVITLTSQTMVLIFSIFIFFGDDVKKELKKIANEIDGRGK